MNGEREQRSFAPETPQEAAILPSFITAPTRVIAPVEPLFEPPEQVAAEAYVADSAETAAPAERVIRRRRPRAGFDEQPVPTPTAVAPENPGSEE